MGNYFGVSNRYSTYLQGIVDSGETESMSQTIRKIILKEMKANETQ